MPISKQELETIDIIGSGSKQMELIDFDKIDKWEGEQDDISICFEHGMILQSSAQSVWFF